MGKGETRRDFITLAGLSLLSLAYSGCSTAEGRDPFIFTPERAGVNCGFALGDLRGLAKANFFVAGDEEGADILSKAFLGDLATRKMSRGFKSSNHVYEASTGSMWKSDKDLAGNMKGQVALIYGVRLSLAKDGPILIKVSGSAPSVVGDQPTEKGFFPTVFVVEVGADDLVDLKLEPTPLCSDESLIKPLEHARDLLSSIGRRLGNFQFYLDRESRILEAVVIPSRYSNEAKSSLNAGSRLKRVAEDINSLAGYEGVSSASLYVNTLTSSGESSDIKLPLAAEVEIMALNQLSDGRVLAGIRPRMRSYLGRDSLQLFNDATTNLSDAMLWVDVMDLQVELERETLEEPPLTVDQGTPTLDSLEKALGTYVMHGRQHHHLRL
ncbi:MAG: hypothetical protein US38_C0015G0011 [Candidatus Roizmanbacteria bacterium GW2011_GWC1_37_12]|nr:MAG: hypothetical protein US38_C0015G0011 [Candidatus Roizmanbacteria bacterium GW2011_GWC1_37_12]